MSLKKIENLINNKTKSVSSTVYSLNQMGKTPVVLDCLKKNNKSLSKDLSFELLDKIQTIDMFGASVNPVSEFLRNSFKDKIIVVEDLNKLTALALSNNIILDSSDLSTNDLLIDFENHFYDSTLIIIDYCNNKYLK